MKEVYELAVTVLEEFEYRLDDTVIALCADVEMVKILCTLVAALRQNGFNYYYKAKFEENNLALIPKAHICYLVDLFFKEGILMGNEKTVANFGSVANYVKTVLQIDEIMKKISKEKYLQVKIPTEFILLSRWLNRIQKIVSTE